MRLLQQHSFHKACGESAFVTVESRPLSTYALDLTILERASKQDGTHSTGTPPSRPPNAPAAETNYFRACKGIGSPGGQEDGVAIAPRTLRAVKGMGSAIT